MGHIALDIGDELVERIAERAAELVAGQRKETVDDGWLRAADKIAAYIDAPRSRVYGLVSAAHPGPSRRFGADRSAL
jgi:hypothetical protein